MQEFALLALVMALVLGAYWAMVIFPKQRDFVKRQRYVQSLNPGDEVVTYGGIVGTIVRVEPEHGLVHVEIAPDIVVRLIMAAIVQPYDAATFTQRTGLPSQPDTSEPTP